MKKSASIVLLFLTLSCAQSTGEQLALINGYWEIASVTTAEGVRKEYSISQNIDFIQIDEHLKGIRKKVQPNLTGAFKATNAQENIDVATDHKKITLQYSTAYDRWNETVVKVSQEQLVIENENGDVYTYCRYTPLSIE